MVQCMGILFFVFVSLNKSGVPGQYASDTPPLHFLKALKSSVNSMGQELLCQPSQNILQQLIESFKGVKRKVLFRRMHMVQRRSHRDRVQSGDRVRKESALQSGMNRFHLHLCTEQLVIALLEYFPYPGILLIAPARVLSAVRG